MSTWPGSGRGSGTSSSSRTSGPPISWIRIARITVLQRLRHSVPVYCPRCTSVGAALDDRQDRGAPTQPARGADQVPVLDLRVRGREHGAAVPLPTLRRVAGQIYRDG